MKINSVGNKNQSFGAKVMISDAGNNALRKFANHNQGFEKYTVNSHKRMLESRRDEETILIDGSNDGTVLTMYLLDTVTRKYADVSYSLESLSKEAKISLLKTYKHLSSMLAKINEENNL